MSVAFTSDAKSRWAADRIAWPNFGKFWAQVVRNAMRKGEAKGIVASVERKDRKATLTLDAIDPSGRFLDGAKTDLTVINRVASIDAPGDGAAWNCRSDGGVGLRPGHRPMGFPPESRPTPRIHGHTHRQIAAINPRIDRPRLEFPSRDCYDLRTWLRNPVRNGFLMQVAA